MEWQFSESGILKASGKVDLPAMEARASQLFHVPFPTLLFNEHKDYHLTFSLQLRENHSWTAAGHEIAITLFG